MLVTAKYNVKGGQILKGTEIDLGKERNTKAVKNGLAVWVDSREFTGARKEVETEKKEGTPKKTITSAKGKKIETK